MKRPKTVVQKLHAKTWTLWSRYIRSRNADWRGFITCYTCPKFAHWKEFDAGHFKHGKLDFDQRNIHPQCTGCNRYWSGRLDVYAENLIKEIGLKEFKQLTRDAEIKGNYYSKTELAEIISDLKEKLKKLDG